MQQLNIKVKYIYHSGFEVETDQCRLIFDFYQGSLEFKDKPTYVFCSHIHPDHFNPAIFGWQIELPGIQYILSNDIGGDQSIPLAPGNITFISPYEEIQINDIKVKAYTSTDEGVAFLVKCGGANIFHAGDLNWWHWAGDIPEEIKRAEIEFKSEIAKIKGEPIDIAFFPVDPRLKPHHGLGAELFISEVKPRYLIPMHFWDDYAMVSRFSAKTKTAATRVVTFTQKGQETVLGN